MLAGPKWEILYLGFVLSPTDPLSEEEEEEKEDMMGLLDFFAVRKRKRQEEAEQEAKRAKGSVRPPMDRVQRYKQS